METTYCPNCMRVLENGAGHRLCPNCGFDFSRYPQPQNALPWYTLLHDRYRVGRVLGQGGFGITYIGFDTNLQCKVAIKEYYPRGVVVRDASRSHSLTWPVSQNAKEKESGCAGFLREARKMARIGNIPGIVRVIDTFTENDTSYIIMDYLEGVTLRKYIMVNGPISFERCLDMLRPLCVSIDRIHQKGMIHRDISPDNIMVLGDGTVWLLDFGAAKDNAVGAGESSIVVARSGFSPSEQYSGKNIGPWTDVYALCATMYFCVSGRSLPDVNERIQDDSIQWGPAEVSDRIRDTFQQGLSIRYSDRIQSVSELIDRLDGDEDKGPLKDDGRGRDGGTGDGRTGNETEVVTDPGGDGGYSVYVGSIAEETAKRKRKSLVKKVSAAAAAILLLAGVAVFAYFRNRANTATEVKEMACTDATGGSGVYTGGWLGGQPSGEGVMTYEDGGVYDGEWVGGLREGRGSMIWADGETYEGEWKGNERDGTGTAAYVNGNVYEGEWKDGLFDGTGTFTWADGSKYEGEWKDGKRNGIGTHTYISGNVYEGEWKDDLFDGTGTFTWVWGDRYVGGWKAGKRDGEGVYYGGPEDSVGKAQIWEDGVCVTPSRPEQWG